MGGGGCRGGVDGFISPEVAREELFTLKGEQGIRKDSCLLLLQFRDILNYIGQ